MPIVSTIKTHFSTVLQKRDLPERYLPEMVTSQAQQEEFSRLSWGSLVREEWPALAIISVILVSLLIVAGFIILGWYPPAVSSDIPPMFP